ncbi:MAG: hypothetical protein EBZ47_08065, partial [Chlamydiae bacterium]|nr:hypothetical protein [Chlamydiota bacterium]
MRQFYLTSIPNYSLYFLSFTLYLCATLGNVNNIWNFIKNKRLFFIGISLFCFLFSIFQLKKLVLNEDISAFVPQDSTTSAATQLLVQSGFSDKIIFHLSDSLGEE